MNKILLFEEIEKHRFLFNDILEEENYEVINVNIDNINGILNSMNDIKLCVLSAFDDRIDEIIQKYAAIYHIIYFSFYKNEVIENVIGKNNCFIKPFDTFAFVKRVKEIMEG
jgi:hypothetical protein